LTDEILTGFGPPIGGWKLRLRPPPPWLSEYVFGYAVDEVVNSSAETLRTRCVPHGMVTVAIEVGEQPGWRLTSGQAPSSPVAGLLDRPQLIELPGAWRGITLLLTPWGAHSLFRLGMHSLTNTHVGLAELLGRSAVRLSERLASEPSWPGRFALVDQALCRWIDERRRSTGEVQHVWTRLLTSGGTVPVEALAQDVGWSRRRLQMRFRDQIGLPPKTIGRVFRFHHAVRLLLPGNRRAGEVAAACGYWDQAHLNRDFRLLSGSSPGELLAALRIFPRRPGPAADRTVMHDRGYS
jgi:AraC-like DNA-binding protein